MNESQAIAALKRLYGKKAAWRYDTRALKGDALEAAAMRSREAHESLHELRGRRDDLRRELLANENYVAICAEVNAAEKEAARISGESRARRVTVGYVSGVGGLEFFHVVAQADNWQEAIDAARAKVSP